MAQKEPDACLYTSGFSTTSTMCSSEIMSSPISQKILQALSQMKENEVVYVPKPMDLDIVKLPFEWHGNISVYLQRNRESQRVRFLIVSKTQTALQRNFDEILKHLWKNSDSILAGLHKLKDQKYYTMLVQYINKINDAKKQIQDTEIQMQKMFN